MKQPPRVLSRRRRGHRRRQVLAAATTLAAAAAVLTACGSGSGKAELVWYTNPDTSGQAKVAENCSTDRYTITTQVLPQDSTQQRIQVARRLAAEDPGIDLISIDPPYTAELANAGYLAPLPQDFQDTLKQQSFDGATASATWKGQLVAAPFWSNTQVLWYRKSFAEKAGLDMNQPVTWDQIIKAASDNGGTVAVQANKYEGYSVWINALIAGAGGEIATDTQAGVNATIDVNSPQGDKAASIIHDLASSSAAPPDLSVSNEGTAAATFGSSSGAFMVNGTFIWTQYDEAQPAVKKDLGYTEYPESTGGEQARPPYGGINIGVSKFSNHVDEAMQAAECITKPDNQGVNAEITGNMPASAAGYDYAPLKKIYPPAVMALFQKSLDDAAPRTVTPYWSDISSSLQSTWHPPSSVNSGTPASSSSFIEDVLHGRSLL